MCHSYGRNDHSTAFALFVASERSRISQRPSRPAIAMATGYLFKALTTCKPKACSSHRLKSGRGGVGVVLLNKILFFSSSQALFPWLPRNQKTNSAFSKTTKSQIACKGLGMLFFLWFLSATHWQPSTQLHNYTGWSVTPLAPARPALHTSHTLLKWCFSHSGTQPYKWLSPHGHTNSPRKQEIHLFSHHESFISFPVDCMNTKAHFSPLFKLQLLTSSTSCTTMSHCLPLWVSCHVIDTHWSTNT